MDPRLVFVVNRLEFLLSHRLPLVLAAQQAGYDVHVIAPPGDDASVLHARGVPVHAWRLDRGGQNAAAEGAALLHLTQLYRRLGPRVVHHVTVKPVLYGSLAARATAVRGVVNAVSGLGYVFMSTGRAAALRRAALRPLYRAALCGPRTVVILQNEADRAELVAQGVLEGARIVMVPGSGVDVRRFEPRPVPPGPPLVVLPARLLKDKGVEEFAAAAAALRARGVAARFALVGDLDPSNPSCVTQAQVDGWVSAGTLEWWGRRADMPEVYAQASVVCLPSYREGMSKALLEAAAAGRPIVTSDAPGCREVVDGGRLGPLVPVGDAAALTEALAGLLLNAPKRQALGAALADFARERFDERLVVDRHLRVWSELV